jgi:AraC family transcriptional regulator of adaptative response / DNA-3-methyladenine glycosylase II
MDINSDRCYEALKARDARFDGVFFVGVSTTKIYCRPVCAVRMPGRDRCTFYPNAASAEAAGYRPCLRCRPELAPGAAPVDAVRRVSDQAVSRIEAGALSDAGIEELAAEFGIGSRQLRRVVKQEYGVAPVELAQTRRLLLAKQLIADTQLRMIDIAFASGFSSVRRFNDLFQTRYKLNPTTLRRTQQMANKSTFITLKLGYRPPLAWMVLARFLTARSSPNIERLENNRYLRTIRIGQHRGWIAAFPDERQHLLCVEVSPDLLPVLMQLRARLRHLFDLDANPAIVEAYLSADKNLAAHIRKMPGLRIPGTLDGFEVALRAVLGQQISVKAATTIFGRFADYFGEQIKTPFDGLDRLPPTAEDIANAKLQSIIDRGLTQKRATTVQALARAVADKKLILQPAINQEEMAEKLAAIPGIGPWTTQYIAMRALADPDAFPHSDLALLKAFQLKRPAELLRIAENWQPWRAYAAMHIWNSMAAGG